MRLAKQLHKVTGRNTYCGPAAVASITGVTTDEAAALFREITERAQCRWVFDHETRAVLAALGFRMVKVDAYKKADAPTLCRWLDKRERHDAVYLVSVTKHYVTVCGNQFADSSRRQICDREHIPHPRAKTRQAWLIEKVKPEGDLVERVTKRSAVRATERSKMAKARRLAKQHTIEIESCRKAYGSEWTGYNVWPADAIGDDRDPYSGDHFAHDADEVLERVQRYVELVK